MIQNLEKYLTRIGKIDILYVDCLLVLHVYVCCAFPPNISVLHNNEFRDIFNGQTRAFCA